MNNDLSAKILEELTALRRTTESLEAKQEELRVSLQAEIRQSGEEVRHSLQAEIRRSGEEVRHGLQAEIRQSGEEVRHSLHAEIRQSGEQVRHSLQSEILQSAEQSRRESGVIAEGLRSEIQQVAEGVILNGERLDRFQAETAREFAETRSMYRFSHAELERRLRTLEDSSGSHEARLQRLESAASH